jgi:hypothetical protein
MNKHPSIVPFILAPLVPAAIMAFYGFNEGMSIKGSLEYAIENAMAFSLVYYLFAGMTTVFIGVPTMLIVKFIWKVTWYTALIGGFAVGTLAYYLFVYKINIEEILRFGLMGAGSGLVFWLASKKYGSTII